RQQGNVWRNSITHNQKEELSIAQCCDHPILKLIHLDAITFELLCHTFFQRNAVLLPLTAEGCQDRLTKAVVIPRGKFFGVINDLGDDGSMLLWILPELGFHDDQPAVKTDVEVVDRSTCCRH